MKRKYEIAVVSRGGFARTLRIYAPKRATRAVIMHDGQNVFYDRDAAYGKSWRAIDVLKSLKIKNTAIIGIDNTATRENDYLPFPVEVKAAKLAFPGGKANAYCEYIDNGVIPYLDKRFGFEFYGMLGSSAGGAATLYYAARKNERVKAYGIYSTPLFLSPTAYKQFFGSAEFGADAFYHIYTGGSESTGEMSDPKAEQLVPQAFVDDAFTITNALRKSGAKNIILDMDNLGVHDEVKWREPEKKFFSVFSKL